MPLKTFLAVLAAVLLTACASPVPKPIRDAPPGNPSVAEVRAEPQRFEGQRVRWGGTIASIRNLPGESRLEVVSRELGGEGRPLSTDRTQGRFIARVEGFLDPAIYSQGRSITVSGRVQKAVAGEIGDYQYRYPVVDVNQHVLWTQVAERPYRYYDPFWDYDPWFVRPYRSYPYPYFYP